MPSPHLFFVHGPKCFWNDRKKLSHFGQNVWKYRLTNTVNGEFWYNCEKQRPECPRDKNVSAKKPGTELSCCFPAWRPSTRTEWTTYPPNSTWSSSIRESSPPRSNRKNSFANSNRRTRVCDSKYERRCRPVCGFHLRCSVVSMLCFESSATGPQPGVKVWGENTFLGGKYFVLIMCFTESFWAQQNLGEHCPRMPPRGQGPARD